MAEQVKSARSDPDWVYGLQLRPLG